MTLKLKLSPWTSAFVLTLAVAFLACGTPAQETAVVPAPAPAPAPVSEPVPEPQAKVVFTDLLPNGVEPLPGVVAGGQPTREQLDQAAARGLKTVINLRTAGESDIGREDVEARGMKYVALPIIGTEGLTAENAAALDAALASAEQPVMVHCGSGNRVGALFALRAHYVEGATAEDALAFGEEAGMTRLKSAVEEILATSGPAAVE